MSSMNDVDGRHACDGSCPGASRFEVIPDPTADGSGAFVFCRMPSGLARVLRWRSTTDACVIFREFDDADSNGRFMSIEVVPAATRN
jgi:hypothetical protein